MKLLIDTHTHTLASGHAYSTIEEMANRAIKKGLKAFVITDHGPAYDRAPDELYFYNLRVLPKIIDGIKLFKGIESNIIDCEGNLDMPDDLLAELDFVYAGFHNCCMPPVSKEMHTQAVVNALKHPCVDAISHPDNPRYPVDIDKVVETAKKYNKLIELNNHSFTGRPGSDDNCKKFALACKEKGVRIVCGSDAHCSFDVGRCEKVNALLEAINMPEAQILNTSLKKFEDYSKERRQRVCIIDTENALRW